MKSVELIYYISYFALLAYCIYKFYNLIKAPKLRQLKDVKNGEFILWTGTDWHIYDGCEILANDPKNKKMYVNIHHNPGSVPQQTRTTLTYDCFLLQDFQTLNTFKNIKFSLKVVSAEKERLTVLLKKYESEEKYEKAAEIKRKLDLLK